MDLTGDTDSALDDETEAGDDDTGGDEDGGLTADSLPDEDLADDDFEPEVFPDVGFVIDDFPDELGVVGRLLPPPLLLPLLLQLLLLLLLLVVVVVTPVEVIVAEVADAEFMVLACANELAIFTKELGF